MYVKTIVFAAFPRLDVNVTLSTRFDQNNSRFYLTCDWAPFEDTDTTLTIYAQYFKNGELFAENNIARNVTSDETLLSSDLNVTYGSEVWEYYIPWIKVPSLTMKACMDNRTHYSFSRC